MPATVRNVAREKLEQGQLSLGVGVRITRSVEIAKAMAAAASGDDGSVAAPHAAAPAADAIANIVDSVLADLRPKIVEEIAKKLQGK